ncbi:hypothetical protein [Anoxybacillus sp. EFIL]|uniref:hypothetical protein n=1 Tax=Anoxybacillus sp. EFIL TaxID=2508869 RepID=UPI00148B8992|nr:hypothetical protein [Anoxybacillus sp. EFIL]NNU96524.1 hypothetical protein [Anoxybacillus sp. EFIL]
MKIVNFDIYKITTPKLKYFVFWTSKKERLDLPNEPFKLKKPTKEFPYEYHMYGDDILIWRKYSDNIFLYDNRYTATSWENVMKYEIYQIISSGRLDKVVKDQFTGEDVYIKFKWTGDPVPKANIEYK